MRRPCPSLPALLLCWLCLLPVAALHAATYTVGASFLPGCTYPDLQTALSAASANPNGPHLIKVAVDSVWGTNVGFTLHNPNADITIQGGYEDCTPSAPDTSANSTLTRTAGSGFSVLSIVADYGRTRHKVTLKQFSITDGSGDAFGGGGIYVAGAIDLDLRDNTRVSGNTTALGSSGGGILADCSVAGGSTSTANPANCAHLTLTDATIDHNAAQRGGGIALFGPAALTLINASIHDNTAQYNGGGLATLSYAGVNELATIRIAPQTSSDLVIFANNTAGDPDNFVPSSGYGGAMSLVDIDLQTITPVAEGYHLLIHDNAANYGGAIAAFGTDDLTKSPVSTVELENAAVYNNSAKDQGGALYSRGGVNWTVWSTAHGPCFFVLFPAPCSYISNNHADNAHSAGGGALGGGAIWISSVIGEPNGYALFKRTLFTGNSVTNPPATVAGVVGGASVAFKRDIFVNNQGPAGSVLVESVGGSDIAFTYDTVLGNDVTRLFSMTGGTLNTQGSILWDPGKPIWYHGSGATMAFNGCLISHTASDIPAGAMVLDPQLGADYTPPPRSPAIDACDNLGFAPLVDFYLRAPVDTKGVTDRYVGGINDLGAVEQTDVIFYGGFGNRPEN